MAGSFPLKILLDTCSFLWLIRGDPQLSRVATESIVDPTHEVFLSVVSAWEIGVKFSLGKLALPVAPSVLVPRERGRHRLESLALQERATLVASELPAHHKDPFDRLLVGQCLADGLTLVSPDPLLRPYPVPILW
jgi:PIN domain nuclease of toxin-antitoxin system